MKRVKIMLSAIAIVSIVGTTVAFKAVKGTGSLYCSTSPNVTAPNTKEFNAEGTLDRYCTTLSGAQGGITASSSIKVTQVIE